jgi:hypothetical protein
VIYFKRKPEVMDDPWARTPDGAEIKIKKDTIYKTQNLNLDTDRATIIPTVEVLILLGKYIDKVQEVG